MPCTGCGACCENIQIHSPRPKLIRDAAVLLGARLGRYDISHWHPSEVESAPFILNRWRVTGRTEDGRLVYACTAFDPDTRRCTVHDERPDVCRGFPFYGNLSAFDTMVDEARRYPECGYVAEALAEVACGG